MNNDLILYSSLSDLYHFINDCAKTFRNRQELEMTHSNELNNWDYFTSSLTVGHQVPHGDHHSLKHQNLTEPRYTVLFALWIRPGYKIKYNSLNHLQGVSVEVNLTRPSTSAQQTDAQIQQYTGWHTLTVDFNDQDAKGAVYYSGVLFFYGLFFTEIHLQGSISDIITSVWYRAIKFCTC